MGVARCRKIVDASNGCVDGQISPMIYTNPEIGAHLTDNVVWTNTIDNIPRTRYIEQENSS